MFFCEPCRAKNMWPQSFHMSYGPCEVCGKSRGCYDVPSKHLPEYDNANAEYDRSKKEK